MQPALISNNITSQTNSYPALATLLPFVTRGGGASVSPLHAVAGGNEEASDKNQNRWRRRRRRRACEEEEEEEEESLQHHSDLADSNLARTTILCSSSEAIGSHISLSHSCCYSTRSTLSFRWSVRSCSSRRRDEVVKLLNLGHGRKRHKKQRSTQNNKLHFWGYFNLN